MKFRAKTPLEEWMFNLDEAKPTASTRRVACLIAKMSRRKGWRWVYPTLKHIAKWLGVSRETVKRAIKWLKETGFIEVSRKYLNNQYRLVFIEEQKCSSVEEVSSGEDSLRSPSPSKPKGPKVQASADGAAQAKPSASSFHRIEVDDIPEYVAAVQSGKVKDTALSTALRRFIDGYAIDESMRRCRQFYRDRGVSRFKNPLAVFINWLNREKWLSRADTPWRIQQQAKCDYWTGQVI